MNDVEKVVKGLEHEVARTEVADLEWLDCVEVALLRDALALLKAQEPRTALNIMKVHEGTLGNCPSCGADLMDYYNETYCGRCGRAVKWE